ncbi:MAG TPA: transposase domain-containing protein [Myxococcaceae bacterium]|nr:transposase domain-containing protein [Myxococcaceae bacterium]
MPSKPPNPAQGVDHQDLGSDAAGHRATSVYSLVLGCYRLGMDPWACLRDVLPKLGDTLFPTSRLAQLLPESWVQQQARQRASAQGQRGADVIRFISWE